MAFLRTEVQTHTRRELVNHCKHSLGEGVEGVSCPFRRDAMNSISDCSCTEDRAVVATGCFFGWFRSRNMFAHFWRARSRLYQNEILQENMRLTAFFKLFKICNLLHPCNLKIFAKNRSEKSAIFVKFSNNFCKC